MTEKLKFVLGRVENIVGKGENAGHQHFLLFPAMFSNGFFPSVVKSWDCVVKSSFFTTQSHLLTTLKKSLLKTLWEKGKMLVTCIFSFSHNVLYPIKDGNHHFSHIRCYLQMLSNWFFPKICRLVKI